MLDGEEEDIKTFKERFMDKGNIDARKIIPYPKEYELLDKVNEGGAKYEPTEEEKRQLILMELEGKYDTSRDGYNQGGYEWCVDNWGSKWGFCDCIVDREEENCLEISFKTAWSPITPLIERISKEIPNLKVSYSAEEESGDFAFDSTWENGVLIEQIDRTDEYQKEIRAKEHYKGSVIRGGGMTWA
jgi:hypothetical protein